MIDKKYAQKIEGDELKQMRLWVGKIWLNYLK